MSSFRGANIAFFVALLASTLVLAPALAHLFELPNKIGLPRDDYFIVQQAYRGWSLLGCLLIVQVTALATTAYLTRMEPHTDARPSCPGIGCGRSSGVLAVHLSSQRRHGELDRHA